MKGKQCTNCHYYWGEDEGINGGTCPNCNGRLEDIWCY